MATVYRPLWPGFVSFPTTNPAAPVETQGTSFPVPGLAFDATTQETCYLFFRAINYGSGNLTATVQWYADSATTGGVVWGGSLAAITPDSDTQDIETKAFATESTAADTHLGTTGQRLHSIDITLSNLDSIASGDWVCLRLRRAPADGSDTMTGDAIVVGLTLSYSDT